MSRVFTRFAKRADTPDTESLTAFIRTVPERVSLIAIDKPKACKLSRGLLGGQYEVSLDAMEGLMNHLYPGIADAIKDADASDDPSRYRVIERLWNTAIRGRAAALAERVLLVDEQSRRVLTAPPANVVYPTRNAMGHAFRAVRGASPMEAWWWDGGTRVVYHIHAESMQDCGLLMEYSATRQMPFRAYRVLFAGGCVMVLPFFCRAVRDSSAVRPATVREELKPVLDLTIPEDVEFINKVRHGAESLVFPELDPRQRAADRRGAQRRVRALLRAAGVPGKLTAGIVSAAVAQAAKAGRNRLSVRHVLRVVGELQRETTDPDTWWILGSAMCQLVRDAQYGWEEDHNGSKGSAAVGRFDARKAAASLCPNS